jgi:hypothetical protein
MQSAAPAGHRDAAHDLLLRASASALRFFPRARVPSVSFCLLLLITLGNLALGFGLAVHLGFGPDFTRLAARWHEFRAARSVRPTREEQPHDPAH